MAQVNISELYGIYELTDIETIVKGKRQPVRANSGMFVFTRDNRMSVVSGSNEWVIAYCGTFQVQENQLIFDIKACNLRDREGSQMKRTIMQLDSTTLILKTPISQEGRQSTLTWTKIQRL